MKPLLLLTVKEYARYRRVSERTVQRWLARHELPAERIGPQGQWRIRVWRCLSYSEPDNETLFSSQGLHM